MRRGLWFRSKGELVSHPQYNEGVVFCDSFVRGLRMPSVMFLKDALQTFKVQLQHLTPNWILS